MASEVISQQDLEAYIAGQEDFTGKHKIPAQLVRAAILQVPIEGVPWQPRTDPTRGLRFANLTITGQLELDDACQPDGSFLPPLTFSNCTFKEPIYLSRARFRTLSLEGSKLAYLRADGIVIDGTLNIANVTTSLLDNPKAITVDIFGNLLESVVVPIRPVGLDPETEQPEAPPIPRIRPGRPAVETWWHRDHNTEPGYLETHKYALEPLCWVHLRDASIRMDVDASGSEFVAPRIRKTFFNSPNARHALDLRGAKIGGSLNIGYDLKSDSVGVKRRDTQTLTLTGQVLLDTLWPEDFQFSKDLETKAEGKEHSVRYPFKAIGGVSIVRAVIGGSVFASGSDLIAVEGDAFSANRAKIAENLLLDYSWEGQCEPEPYADKTAAEKLAAIPKQNFRALGFVNLSHCEIGSRLFMMGALLGADTRSRAGLVATGMQVRGSCSFDAYSPASSPFPQPPSQFISKGGVVLNRAQISGDMNLQGALLQESSFGTALYAQNLAITGELNLEGFHAYAPVVLEAANVGKAIKMENATFQDAYLDLSNATVASVSLSGFTLKGMPPDDKFLRFVRLRVRGKLTIRRYGCALHSRHTRTYYADLRECEVDSLDDDHGRGWGYDLILQLQSFVCRQAPIRENGLSLPASETGGRILMGREHHSLRGLVPSTSKECADGHLRWLNLQYANAKNPQESEFSPSAYDQLAKSLRDDGRDRQANRVLSAKLTVKHQVGDVPPLAKPLWNLYHFFFDYGLSSVACIGTFLLMCAIGWGGFFLAVKTKQMVAVKGPLSTISANGRVAIQASDPARRESVINEVPCEAGTINTFLYAVDVFVPGLDLGQEKLCELKPKATFSRFLEASYVALGWIVTSITLLAIPGILRRRAED